MTLAELRARHPRLTYRSVSTTLEPDGLVITCTYHLEPDVTFTPRLLIKNVTQHQLDQISPLELQLWAFNLGLAELPSYWKAACPAEIVIDAGPLTSAQQRWWHHLLMNGLGEFFYVNSIDFTQPDLVSWKITNPETELGGSSASKPTSIPVHRPLIPVGGGKDSVVTLELVRQKYSNTGVFQLNPSAATHAVTGIAHPAEIVRAERTIDPQLLELNRQGYLNGHTPFSAYLAFASSLAARLFGYSHILLSNERSSNEGNIVFHGQEINHQYSKSFEFEQAFQHYIEQYLQPLSPHPQPVYCSFLRPLYELQIAERFSQFPAYFEVFRSCNRGQKTNSWCESCPKCLFAYGMLYPFLDSDQLGQIFSHDLFADDHLLETALELVGRGKLKPLECVGMYEESLVGYYLSYQKALSDLKPMPSLLQQIKTRVLDHESNLEARTNSILNGWNHDHTLPDELLSLLTKKTP